MTFLALQPHRSRVWGAVEFRGYRRGWRNSALVVIKVCRTFRGFAWNRAGWLRLAAREKPDELPKEAKYPSDEPAHLFWYFATSRGWLQEYYTRLENNLTAARAASEMGTRSAASWGEV